MKNPLFCLVSKETIYRARIIQHAKDRYLYRADDLALAAGGLNVLADFTFNPKGTVMTADRIGT